MLSLIIFKMKTQIPPDFKVSDRIRELAKKKGWPSPDGEVEQFIDYWLGTGDKMADWEAVFRNRLRQVKKWGDKSSRLTPTVNPVANRNQKDMSPEEHEKNIKRLDELVGDLAKAKNVRET